MSWKYSDFKRRGLSESKDDTSFDGIAAAVQTGDTEIISNLLAHKNIEFVDYSNLTVLHVAARWGNADVLRLLLEDKRIFKLLDNKMYNGETAILTAARHGNLAGLRVFMDYGADILDTKFDNGNTVLHFAARSNDCDLMNTLLNYNLPATFINIANNAGETALELAFKRNPPAVQLLLQAGANYCKPNIFTGRNILHTSVAYDQCGIVQELLTSNRSRELVDVTDHRGDTPLMLAARLACFQCVQSLVSSLKPGKEVNQNTGESILHIIVQTDADEILKYVLMFSHEKLIKQRDANGMTPLLMAIEYKKDKCLERLFKTQNIYAINENTKETALHTAIRVNNRLALSILLQHNNNAISWCFSQRDNEGNTPFWVAVEKGHAHVIVESRKGGWVDVDEQNKFGDSPTFVAAANGHLKVLKALLLSEKYYEFCQEHEKDADLKEQKLIMSAEICCDIYNTDIFILTNKKRKNKLHTWLPKSFLNANKRTGRNIYHGCAMGGNVQCLNFVNNFCSEFSFNVELFDSPDENGNTPLLLATKNDYGGPECVYFFLSNGANISSHNKSGDFVLNSLLINTENSIDLLKTVMTEAIVYDVSARGLQEESECLQVDYSLFRPPNESVTNVVKMFYEAIQGPHRTHLLQNALFKTYVNLMTESVKYFFILRFVISCLSTLLLAIYLLFYSSGENEIADQSVFIIGIRCTLIVLSVFGILFSIPLMFHKKIGLLEIFTYTLMLLPCVLVICLIMVPYGSQRSFEVAALTVLVSWLSLMMYSTSIFKEISHQIAMLSQVMCGMMIYFWTVILILLPFSLAFYCIFSDYFYFINPVKSFIYTSFILLQGDTIQCFYYFESKHFVRYKGENGSVVAHNPGVSYFFSHLDMFLESTFLLVFIITCVLGLLNMLVGLAVRDGKTLADDGEVFRRRLQIHWLNSLEEFLGSFLYRVLRPTPLIYFLGVIPSRTLIDLRSRYNPMAEKKSSVFSHKCVIEMKKSAGRAQRERHSNTFIRDNLNTKMQETPKLTPVL